MILFFESSSIFLYFSKTKKTIPGWCMEQKRKQIVGFAIGIGLENKCG
jgi:hypothetical protein